MWGEFKYFIQWMVLRILLFNILIGGVGILLILYELIADKVGIRAPELDKLSNFFGALMTFVAVAVTAASIFYCKEKMTRPSSESYWVAFSVILGCIICIYFLFRTGHVPGNIINGFALLGLAGGLLRIQPNPQRAATSA